MNLLTPILAGVAAAIAIPTLIILYFLKLRRRDVEVSTTLLWKKAVQDLQANAPFQKLRRNILLFLQLLALAALIFAAAQPQLRGAGSDAGRVVLFLDRSASMQAVDETGDGGPISRLDRAKLDALAYVESLGAGSTGVKLLDDLLGRKASPEAMVVAFDAGARVVQPFTSNKAVLREAIERIGPSDAPGDFTEAARITAAIVGPQKTELEGGQSVQYDPGVPAVLWSDGGVAALDEFELHPDSVISYRRVGGADAVNHAITAMRADRAYDQPAVAEVFIGVQSTSPDPVTLTLELTENALVSQLKEVRLGGAESPARPAVGGAVFRLERRDAVVLGARVVEADALPVDNVARLVVPPATRLSAALVTQGNLFIQAAIESKGMRLSRRAVLSPAEFEAMRGEGRLGEFDVYILDRYLPEGCAFGTDEPDGGMPPGRYLIYGASPPLPGIAPPLPDVELGVDQVVDWDRGHPALAYLNLDPVIVRRPSGLRASPRGDVLVRGSTGPLVVEAVGVAARAIVVGFAVAESTWVFDPSFVLFLARAISHLGDEGATVAQQSLGPGENLVTRLPSGATGVELTHPDGSITPLAPDVDGRAIYGPLSRTGLYTLAWSGEPGPSDEVIAGRPRRTVAVNLFDPTESRIESLDAIGLPIGDVTAQEAAGREGAGRRRLWPWLVLAALAVIMVEWFVYNRKVHV